MLRLTYFKTLFVSVSVLIALGSPFGFTFFTAISPSAVLCGKKSMKLTYSSSTVSVIILQKLRFVKSIHKIFT